MGDVRTRTGSACSSRRDLASLTALVLAAAALQCPGVAGAAPRGPLATPARAARAGANVFLSVTRVAPKKGSAAGGQPIAIIGHGFVAVSAVSFGAASAASFKVNSESSITAVSPPGATGTVDVRVSAIEGTTPISSKDHFTFTPAVSGVGPSAGPTAGGASVTISGSGFVPGATTFRFGSKNASTVECTSASSCTAVTPKHARGPVDVVATVNGLRGEKARPADSYTYDAPPTVTGVSPREGPEAGGASVVISGTNFTAGSSVAFGATPAAKVTLNSATSITATSPKGAGTVNVTVTTPGGTSEVQAADEYTYRPVPTIVSLMPNEGPETGATAVTIAGNGFTPTSLVKFGATPATSVNVSSSYSITAIAPAGSGVVTFEDTTAGGTTAASEADKYTYVPPPAISKLAPNTGPEVGNTSVVIEGIHFTKATAVKFGSNAATTFTVNSDTTITAVSPPGSATVDVTVTTVGGTSAIGEADRFTYIKTP